MAQQPFDTPWRRVAAAAFEAPGESVVGMDMEIDLTALEAYRRARRAPGLRLLPVHFVIAAVARTIAAEVPEFNVYLHRGRIRPRESLDIVLPAVLPGTQELVDVRVAEAHRKTVEEIAHDIRRQMHAYRNRDRADLVRQKFALARLPWPLRRPLFSFLRWLSVGCGFSLPRFEMAPDRFGTLVVTEVGRFTPGLRVFGLRGAIFPAAQNAGMLALAPPYEAVVVKEGEMIAQPTLTLCGTFDHRLVDGLHIGKLYNGIYRRLQQPQLLDQAPEADA